ncbi:MAG: hypothetical protein WBE80_00590 [Methylocella sp.]
MSKYVRKTAGSVNSEPVADALKIVARLVDKIAWRPLSAATLKGSKPNQVYKVYMEKAMENIGKDKTI